MPNYQAHDKMYLELINNMFRVSFVVKIYNCSLVFFYLNIFFIHGNRSFLNYYLKFIFFQITIYFFFLFQLSTSYSRRSVTSSNLITDTSLSRYHLLPLLQHASFFTINNNSISKSIPLTCEAILAPRKKGITVESYTKI